MSIRNLGENPLPKELVLSGKWKSLSNGTESADTEIILFRQNNLVTAYIYQFEIAIGASTKDSDIVFDVDVPDGWKPRFDPDNTAQSDICNFRLKEASWEVGIFRYDNTGFNFNIRKIDNSNFNYEAGNTEFNQFFAQYIIQ